MTIAFLALSALTSLLILGAVQGATEFLPVSSSGHLVLSREWLGIEGHGSLRREIALHLGTLVAVIVFCYRDILTMLRKGSGGLWRLMIGSTFITGVLGLTLKDTIETNLNSALSAGIGLLITSALLLVIAPKDDEAQTRELDDGSLLDSIMLGLFQSLALVPGVSRAGATIVAALLLGFRRPHAVRIAFLMSIPVVGGAVLLQALDVDESADAAAGFSVELMAGTVLAGVVGLLCLKFISARIDAVNLRRFGMYTLVLGVLAIVTT
jgi:undecaprenyl-diphosphatase